MAVPTQPPPICYRTIGPVERSALFAPNAAPPEIGGAPCIGGRCAAYVALAGEGGRITAAGCSVQVMAGFLASTLPVLAQVAGAWHNDRIAEKVPSKAPTA